MSDSVSQARREVQACFEQALALCLTEAPTSLYALETSLWDSLLALGRALLSLFLAQKAARKRPSSYLYGGRRFLLEGRRSDQIGTRFGKVLFSRPFGLDAKNPRAACDLPLDRELGLCGSFSLSVVLLVTNLCAKMAFGAALSTFRETYRWAPSTNVALRFVDAAGEKARLFLEQAEAPPEEGKVLVIQVDAKGTPHLSSQELSRRRRPRGERKGTKRQRERIRRLSQNRSQKPKGGKNQTKNAKMAVVGVIYTLKQTPQGLEGPVNKRVYATYQGHEALFVWLSREAKKRGYGEKPTVFLGDGSEHIWRRQKRYFGEALVCVDWYHAVEKLWEVGRALYPKARQEFARAQWVGKRVEFLWKGEVRVVSEALRREYHELGSGPGTKEKREKLLKVREYFEEHEKRMRYGELREWGLDIGTGVVEGAVRNLVGLRQDGPGMRWGRGRDEKVLHLRCVLLNGQWQEFSQFLERAGPLKLLPKPIPAQPHDAKAAA